jgi:flagellar hook-associated protein 3 FlgL
MIRREALDNIQSNYRAIADGQLAVASGHRIQRASDDPNAAAQVLQLRGALRAVSQYQRNIDDGASRLSGEEGVLDQLTDTLSRGRELAVSQGSDTASASTRLTTKAEVDNLIASARDLGNKTYLDSYLFGGIAADAAPFDVVGAPFSSHPPVGSHDIEVAAQQRMPTVHNATQIFLDTGALQALQDLSTALGANDAEGIRVASGTLAAASDKVQALLGEVGARTNQLQTMKTSLGSLSADLDAARSGLEDTDMDTAITDVMSRQTTLQAALLTTQRILGISLTDYM